MHELKPGSFTALFQPLYAVFPALAATSLTAVAERIEQAVKADLTRLQHAHGTPTPASPGGPPAMISGTLAGSIKHSSPELSAAGVEVRVGTELGHYPPYQRGRTRTASAKYGAILNAGRYPFMTSAFERATSGAAAAQIITSAFLEKFTIIR